MKDQHFNDILNECLDRLLKGETLEQCLKDYPEYAKDLEPLLRTSQAARAFSNFQPRPEFKARARYEFQIALRDLEKRKVKRPLFSGWQWRWQSAWSVAIAIVLMIVVAGGGTAAAASGSMPDSALYPVKIAAEKVQMVFTFSDIGKAELNSKLADRRVDELVYLAMNGDVQEIQAVASRLNTNLENINNLVVKDPASRQTVAGLNNTNKSVDTSAQTEVSKPALSAGQSTPTAAAAPPNSTSTLAATIPAPGDKGGLATPVVPSPVTSTSSENINDSKTVTYVENQSQLEAYRQTYQEQGNNLDEIEKLKQTIINLALTHPARLEEALSKAPPELRPALREAITKALDGYNILAQNIDNIVK